MVIDAISAFVAVVVLALLVAVVGRVSLDNDAIAPMDFYFGN